MIGVADDLPKLWDKPSRGSTADGRNGDNGIIVDVPSDPLVNVGRTLHGVLNDTLAYLDPAGAADLTYMPCLSGNAGPELVPQFKWTEPIRVAQTRTPEINQLLDRALVEIRARVPHAPLDNASFPVPFGKANVFFSGDGSSFRPYDLVLNCLPRLACNSLSGIARMEQVKPSQTATVAWLERSYVTSPLGHLLEEDAALIETGALGTIVGAACGSGPIDRPVELVEMQFVSCLLQAMGAYPARYRGPLDRDDPNYELKKLQHIISDEFKQLNTLYK
jgi:hypothetical protein